MTITRIQLAAPLASSEPAKPVTAAAPSASGEHVDVGGEAKLRRLESIAKDVAADRRAERLAELKAQVRANGYRPDAARIAEEILREAELQAELRSLLL